MLKIAVENGFLNDATLTTVGKTIPLQRFAGFMDFFK